MAGASRCVSMDQHSAAESHMLQGSKRRMASASKTVQTAAAIGGRSILLRARAGGHFGCKCINISTNSAFPQQSGIVCSSTTPRMLVDGARGQCCPSPGYAMLKHLFDGRTCRRSATLELNSHGGPAGIAESIRNCFHDERAKHCENHTGPN